MKLTDRTSVVLLITAGLAVAALGLVVPPFQFPDEPHHFAAVMIQAWGEGRREAIERETIVLMDKYDWWGPAGMGRPAVLPQRISDIKFLMAGNTSGDFSVRIQGFLLYHKLMGKIIAGIGRQSLIFNYYLARFFAFGFLLGGIAVFGLGIKTTADVFGIDLGWALPFAAFLPQLTFAGTGVAPDAFVFLLGAVCFWAAASLVSGKGRFIHAAALVLCAAAGFAVDRSAFVFGAVAILVPLMMMRPGRRGRIIAGTLIGAIGLILLLYVMALRFPVQVESGVLALKSVTGSVRKAIPALFALSPFEAKFWLQLVDSAFLRYGWMHFGPPVIVVWIWRLFCAAGGAGLIVGFISFARKRMNDVGESESSVIRRRFVVLAAASVALQAFGLWSFYGVSGIHTQGRYLFPVLPFLVLLVGIGIDKLGGLLRPKAGAKIVLGFVIFEIFVWIYALWAIAIPVFRLTIRSPYPGV